jgi:hypothetical protein
MNWTGVQWDVLISALIHQRVTPIECYSFQRHAGLIFSQREYQWQTYDFKKIEESMGSVRRMRKLQKAIPSRLVITGSHPYPENSGKSVHVRNTADGRYARDERRASKAALRPPAVFSPSISVAILSARCVLRQTIAAAN